MIGLMAQAIGWLLLLSIPIAAIAGVAVWISLRLVPPDEPRLRSSIVNGGIALVGIALVVAAGAALPEWRAHVACWSLLGTEKAHTAECQWHGLPGPADGSIATTSSSGEASESGPGMIRSIARDGGIVVQVAGAMWLVLMLPIGLREIGARRRLTKTLRASGAPDESWIVDDLRALARRLRIDRPVALRVSSSIDTPCVTGARPVTILLPDGLEKILERRELRGVLAHELAHVARRDPRVSRCQRWCEVALFFNPFARWLVERGREEREAACDLTGAEIGTRSRKRYAEALLLLERFRSVPRPSGVVVSLLGEADLVARVRRLRGADASRRGRSTIRPWSLAVLTILLVGALSVISLSGSALASWALMADDIDRREASIS